MQKFRSLSQFADKLQSKELKEISSGPQISKKKPAKSNIFLLNFAVARGKCIVSFYFYPPPLGTICKHWQCTKYYDKMPFEFRNYTKYLRQLNTTINSIYSPKCNACVYNYYTRNIIHINDCLV